MPLITPHASSARQFVVAAVPRRSEVGAWYLIIYVLRDALVGRHLRKSLGPATALADCRWAETRHDGPCISRHPRLESGRECESEARQFNSAKA